MDDEKLQLLDDNIQGIVSAWDKDVLDGDTVFGYLNEHHILGGDIVWLNIMADHIQEVTLHYWRIKMEKKRKKKLEDKERQKFMMQTKIEFQGFLLEQVTQEVNQAYESFDTASCEVDYVDKMLLFAESNRVSVGTVLPMLENRKEYDHKKIFNKERIKRKKESEI